MENYLPRIIEKSFIKKMQPNKVLLLLGARRVGKTSFLQQIIKKLKEKTLFLNGEDMETALLLKHRSVENYKRIIGKNKILIIDEAQKIPDIGNILKLMVDEIKGIKIIATGSSAFDLSNRLGEPLTGRSWTFYMFPFAQLEWSKEENLIQTRSRLEERMIFGNYPELWKYPGKDEKIDYLKQLVNTSLLRDILVFDGIRNSEKLIDILRLVALQMGKEVSVHELAQQLGIARATVEHYLDLLSKVFIIYKVKAFSRNIRKEISKNHKWYFYDSGIRNTLISNFNPLSIRNDKGELWENYLLAERIKYQNYTGLLVNNYFWRTYQQQEIDWIEERGGLLYAYELKWNSKKEAKLPKAWKDNYPDSIFKVIHPDNYLDWIT